MSDSRPWRRLYGTAQWQRLRKKQLSFYPLCAYCQQDGIITAATVVDHREAHMGDHVKFFDFENLQSLCKPHHDTSKQREGIRGLRIGASVDGTPLDPAHPWNVQTQPSC